MFRFHERLARIELHVAVQHMTNLTFHSDLNPCSFFCLRVLILLISTSLISNLLLLGLSVFRLGIIQSFTSVFGRYLLIFAFFLFSFRFSRINFFYFFYLFFLLNKKS